MPLEKRISNFAQLSKRAKKCFKTNLIGVGYGGSGFKGTDIDTVVILRKMNFDQIKKFANDQISVVPMTQLMYDNREMWPAKFITMALKGFQFDFGKIKIDKVLAKKLTQPLIPEAIYALNRAIIREKINEKQALDLTIQYLTILQ